MDDATDDESVVLAASGIPALSSPHPLDPTSIVIRREAVRRSDEWSEWRVNVHYSRQSGSTDDRTAPPTLRPVARSAGFRAVQKAVIKTLNGDPIVVPGTETPYDPPVQVLKYNPVVRFQRWEASFSTGTQKTYLGKVNSGQFGAYGPGEVMCTALDADEEWENDGNGTIRRYWRVLYEFEADEDGWQPRLQTADYFHIDPADSKRVPIFIGDDGTAFDANDNPFTSSNGDAAPHPMLLYAQDIGGIVAGEIAPAANISSAIADGSFNDKFTKVYDVHGEADFTALALPID